MGFKPLKSKPEQIKHRLTALPAGELAWFDVRSHVFEQLAPCWLSPSQQAEWGSDWTLYTNTDNLLIKVCLGKKWAQRERLNYDYDSSLFVSSLFCLLGKQFFPRAGCQILPSPYSQHEYILCCGGRTYRGDTMHSWSTTLNRFFRLFGSDYLTVHSPIGWQLLGDPAAYQPKVLLPEEMQAFLKVVYTIGNFIPVPAGFNTGRAAPTRDYWDLTLLAIHQYYAGAGENSALADVFRLDSVQQWLDSFGDWEAFAQANFLTPFLEIQGTRCGRPLELWDGHFTGSILPETREQFMQFFCRASAGITARGMLLAEAVQNCQRSRNG